MKKYLVLLEIESESDPRDWYLPEVLVIDDEYKLVKVEEVEA